MHEMVRAFSFASANAGSNIAASTAMIAITTSSSIKVNALRVRIFAKSSGAFVIISNRNFAIARDMQLT
jgi:hypothetical protein